VIRLSNEEERLYKSLPSTPFTSREVGSGRTCYTLCGLEEKGLVRRKGTTGRLGRYILWEKNRIINPQ